jgi:hypothetical protein
VEHVERMKEMRHAYKILIGKPKGNIQPARSTRRWEDNIRMKFILKKRGDVDCLNLPQGRIRWRDMMKLRVL